MSISSRLFPDGFSHCINPLPSFDDNDDTPRTLFWNQIRDAGPLELSERESIIQMRYFTCRTCTVASVYWLLTIGEGLAHTSGERQRYRICAAEVCCIPIHLRKRKYFSADLQYARITMMFNDL